MDRLDRVLKARKLNGMTWEELAEGLPISGQGVRVAFTRKKLHEDYLEAIENKLGLISKTDSNNQDKFENEKGSVEDLIAKKVLLLLQPEIENIKTQLVGLRAEIRNLERK